MQTIATISATGRLFGVLCAVDVAIILVLLLNMVVGFWSGFVWQLVRIVSLVVSVWVAFLYGPTVADSIGIQFSEPVRLFGGAVAVFMAVVTVCYLLAYLFRDVVDALKPELADRILGAVFGVFKGALVVAVLSFLVLEYTGEESRARAYVQQSKAAAALGSVLGYALPDSLREKMKTPTKPDTSQEAASTEGCVSCQGPGAV